MSAGHLVLPYPAFAAGPPSYDDGGGSTIVTFTLSPAAGQARARVVTTIDPSPDWQDCASGDGTTWTCPVPGLTAADAAAGTFEWVATS